MSDRGEGLAVDMPVRVYPGTVVEKRGVILDDFGDTVGVGVHVADNHIVAPARRWAVQLDTGDLVFVDSDQLAAG
jgi:hypothetical protein